jgi:UMF1 family MFS transporter
MPSPLLRRPVFSWALYDWGNSAFATTVMAGFFPVFLKQYWSAGADPTVSTFRLGVGNGIASLVIAVLAPFLGAVADRSGARLKFLTAFTVLGVAATFSFYFIAKGDWSLAVLVYVLGSLGFSGAIIFYDSLILDVAEGPELDMVSSFGYALGYLGGGLLFAANVAMTIKPKLFGLDGAADAVRLSFVSVAVWWALFTIPILLSVRQRQNGPRVPVSAALGAGFRELVATLQHIRQYRMLTLFLAAYWLYIDGVNTVIKMAVDYGLALGFPSTSLITALLLTQFVAFPAALLFGWLGNRLGTRTALLIAIAVYLVVTVWAYWLDNVAEFYLMAAVIGLVQGGVQSLSRSFYGRLIPPEKSGEFFGFFNMMGKFATVIGPVLMGVVGLLTSSSRASILSVALLFLAGGALLLLVREEPAPRAPAP